MKLFEKKINLNYYNIYIYVLAVAGATLVYLSNVNYGSALTSDSIGYIGLARNLIEGNGFLNYNGEYFVYQPPLYPLLLAFTGKYIGIDPLQLTNVINSLIHGLVILITGSYSLKLFSSNTVIAIGGIFLICLSNVLFTINVMALSEPLFILLIIICLYLFYLYLNQNNIKYLLLLSITTALAALTKYVGITLIFWGIIVIFLFDKNSLKIKIKSSFIFSVISSIPLGIWLIRNIIVSGTMTGPRTPSIFNPLPKLNDLTITISKWFVHPLFLEYKEIIFLLIIVFILLTIYILYKSQEVKIESFYGIAPTTIFIILYTILLIVSTTKYSVEVDDRLLSPIYIPLLIVILFVINLVISHFQKKHTSNSLNILFVICFLIWSVYPIRATILHSKKLTNYGQGFNSAEWKNNQLIKYLQMNGSFYSDKEIYSNEPYATYILANIQTGISPYKSKSIDIKVDDWPKEESAYLIWYHTINYDALMLLNELQKSSNINELVNFEDGSIYLVSSK